MCVVCLVTYLQAFNIEARARFSISRKIPSSVRTLLIADVYVLIDAGGLPKSMR